MNAQESRELSLKHDLEDAIIIIKGNAHSGLDYVYVTCLLPETIRELKKMGYEVKLKYSLFAPLRFKISW